MFKTAMFQPFFAVKICIIVQLDLQVYTLTKPLLRNLHFRPAAFSRAANGALCQDQAQKCAAKPIRAQAGQPLALSKKT